MNLFSKCIKMSSGGPIAGVRASVTPLSSWPNKARRSIKIKEIKGIREKEKKQKEIERERKNVYTSPGG